MSRRTAGAAAIAALALALVGAGEERDAAYWAGRMEQALIPRASLRADVVVRTRAGAGAPLELRAEVARVQGPHRIRTLVVVRSPSSERRVVRITSTSAGGVERALYVGKGTPTRLRLDRTDRIPRTAFTWEDLGFVEPRELAAAEVGFEDLPGGRVVRLTTGAYGPYGKVVVRLDPDSALPRKIESFDRNGRLERTVTYQDVRRKELYQFPLRIEAVDADSGRRSEVRIEHLELGADVYEHEFGDRHLNQLARGLGDEASF